MYLGNVQRNLKLNGATHGLSCGATLNGQHWIIGGGNDERQVSDEPDKPMKVKLWVFR